MENNKITLNPFNAFINKEWEAQMRELFPSEFDIITYNGYSSSGYKANKTLISVVDKNKVKEQVSAKTETTKNKQDIVIEFFGNFVDVNAITKTQNELNEDIFDDEWVRTTDRYKLYSSYGGLTAIPCYKTETDDFSSATSHHVEGFVVVDKNLNIVAKSKTRFSVSINDPITVAKMLFNAGPCAIAFADERIMKDRKNIELLVDAFNQRLTKLSNDKNEEQIDKEKEQLEKVLKLLEKEFKRKKESSALYGASL